jgi:hypothetical protein
MTIPRPLKWILWIVSTLAALGTIMVLLLIWLFSGLVGEPSNDEVARTISPDGRVDAVLFETNGGATTSYGYRMYVVEHGAKPVGPPAISLYGAVRNNSAYGANLKWLSHESVAVEYLSAESTSINRSTITIGNKIVQIAVREGIADNAAPAGGMLYNLRGRQ